MDVDESNADRAPCTLRLKKEFYQHNPTYIIGPGSLIAQDVLRLIEPRRMLNDNIINLGLQFCQSDLSLRCPSMHNEFFFFDTFFYTKLRAAGNETVAKIFKKCPLNEKKFVFMPIHLMEAVHWLLCLLYLHRPNLGGAVQSVHLFLLDSLRSGTRGDLIKRLEWCIRRVAVHQKLQLPVQFVVQWIKVPQQNNLVDCGLYLLHFVQRILDNPMEFISAFMDGDTNCVWDEDKIPGTRERLIRRVSELVDEFSKKVIEVDEEGDEFELIEGPLIHSRITTQTAGADRAASPMEVDGPGQIGERTPLAVPEALAEHEMEIDSDAGPSVEPDARSTTNAATSASLSISMHVVLPRRLPQRVQNVEAGPYVCPPCQSLMEHCARQVAAIVPELDRATIEDLEGRLEDGNDWQLDDENNIPECWGRHEGETSDRCNVSEHYSRHLKAAELGLWSDEEYMKYERYLEEIKNPRIIIGDVEVPPVTRPPQDAGLVQHMQSLRLLRGARGRLVMNKFLHEDPAAQQRLKGVCAGLDGTISAKVMQRDQQQSELDELKRGLEQLRRGVVEGRQQLQQVEAARHVTMESLHSEPQHASIPHSPSNRSITSAPILQSGGPSSDPASTLALTDFSQEGLAQLSPHDLEKLRNVLRRMKRPGYDVVAEMLARWIQVHADTTIKGVPISQPNLTVDLRDVRGRNRIMRLVPPKEQKRQQHQLCLLSLLGVLAVPYAYATLLQKAGMQVAGATSADQAAWTQSVTDDEVVQFLANQGLTVAEADDSWQFAWHHVQAIVHERSRTGVGRPDDVRYAALLAQIEAEVKVRGKPPGLRREEDDRLGCFPGLMGYQKGVVPVFDFTEKLLALGVQSQPVQKPPLPPTARPPPARLRQGGSRNGEKAEREASRYRGQAGRSYEAEDERRTGGVFGRGRGYDSHGPGPSGRGHQRVDGQHYTAPFNSARSWRRSRSPSDRRGK
ncbi:hypothetical protein B0H16DRAFT_1715361 [Mycena metata]|uniref:Ubiquitin-like protease family profile domain-containing protein n=1 Tax=Mycena metata TaxID=1033252 RepID=A0AAD7NPW1_9AGAR|nr:hypothetical protein B0H16DRAFT_1715361 [Mycena metata]